LEAAKIAGLGQLAATQPAAEAATTYRDLFIFAIGAEQYTAAEPFAAKVVAADDSPVEVLALAQMITVVAKVSQGDFDGSIAHFSMAVNASRDAAKGGKTPRALPLPARIALLTNYVQRLIHAGRHDVAAKALKIVRDATQEPSIKELAESRLVQLELVGKPAPALVGTDLDGKPVKLSDHKGDVVLVLFWASWSSVNYSEAARFNDLQKQFAKKGFRIIGVNVDTKQDGGVPAASVMTAVKRFLIENNVQWPNLINGAGEKDYAAAFGVTQIPSDFLIGRDGKVLRLDVTVESLKTLLESL